MLFSRWMTYFLETYELISGKHKIQSGAFVWFFVEKLSFTDLSIKSTIRLVDQEFLWSRTVLHCYAFYWLNENKYNLQPDK